MDPSIDLISTRLKQDVRVLKAKKLLKEALFDYQNQIKKPCPADPQLIKKYDEILNAFQEFRGGKLYFPYLGSGLGNGPLVELFDGSVKYDMISGIGPHFFGHSFFPLIDIAIDASLNDTVMQGHLQQNLDAYLLSKLLIDVSHMDHCFLSSSGAMANENALKIAFQSRFPANRILAFERCFMGRTLALSQITDKPAYRDGLPPSLFVDYIPFYNQEDPENSTQQSLKALEKHLTRYPRQYAAMCFELVQGEGGFHVGTTQYFSSLMRLLKKHEICVLIDEIQTFGRTPELFAFQYFHLEEFVDIVTIGKISQVCATLFKGKLKPKAGLLSQTFTSSTAALHASYWIIQYLITHDFYGPNGKIVRLHERFKRHLNRLEKKWPDRICGPYGMGAMVIFTPFDGKPERVARFVQDLFQAGVISFVAGSDPTRVRFLIPAGVMKGEDVDAVMQIVEEVLSI